MAWISSAIEICGQKKRVLASTGIYYLYIVSEFVVVLLAFLIRNYKLLYLAYTAMLVSFLFIVWPVPESPRWLLTKGRNAEALKIFTKIARSNKKPMETLVELNKLSQEKTAVQDFDEASVSELDAQPPSVSQPTTNTFSWLLLLQQLIELSAFKFIDFLKQAKKLMKSRKFLMYGIVILINW